MFVSASNYNVPCEPTLVEHDEFVVLRFGSAVDPAIGMDWPELLLVQRAINAYVERRQKEIDAAVHAVFDPFQRAAEERDAQRQVGPHGL